MHILWIKPEMLLYLYMASCVAVLIFNIVYIFYMKLNGHRLYRRRLEMTKELRMQLEHIERFGEADLVYMKKLPPRLCHLHTMRVFENSMAECQKLEDCAEAYRIFRKALRPVFIRLIPHYLKRDDVEQAYFCSLIGSYALEYGHHESDAVNEFLIQMISSQDIYVRVNALKAIFAIGDKDIVLSAWEKMEDNQVGCSSKLLADGLLGFAGDRDELARALWKNRGRFREQLIFPMMQFIRFYTDAFQEEFLQLMNDDKADKELRLEAIRYFRKYPYEPAKQYLIVFLQYQEFLDWEYAAIAASTLASYGGEDVVQCLKDALSAHNWYVRYNAAETLIYGLRVPQIRLFDVYNGKDRYAREVLNYIDERQQIAERKMKLEN